MGAKGFDGRVSPLADPEFDSPARPLPKEILDALARGAKRVLKAHSVCANCGREGGEIAECSCAGTDS